MHFWARLGGWRALAAQFGEAFFHGVVEAEQTRILLRRGAERAVDFEGVGVGDGAEQHIGVGGAARENFEALIEFGQLLRQGKRVLEDDFIEIARHVVGAVVDGILGVLDKRNRIGAHFGQAKALFVGQRAQVGREQGFELRDERADLHEFGVGHRRGNSNIGNRLHWV